MKHVIFLLRLRHFGFSHPGHQRIVLFAKLYLVLLRHSNLVLEGGDTGYESLPLEVERLTTIGVLAGLLARPLQVLQKFDLTRQVTQLHLTLHVLVAQLKTMLLRLHQLLIDLVQVRVLLADLLFNLLRLSQELVEFI